MDDAEVALIGLGSTMGTVRFVVDQLREEGVKVGMLKLRLYRPFPEDALVEALGDTLVLGVLDKAISFGAPGGPLYQDIRSLFYDREDKPLVANYIYGLGGRDASPQLLRGIYDALLEIHRSRKLSNNVNYVGVRE